MEAIAALIFALVVFSFVALLVYLFMFNLIFDFRITRNKSGSLITINNFCFNDLRGAEFLRLNLMNKERVFLTNVKTSYADISLYLLVAGSYSSVKIYTSGPNASWANYIDRKLVKKVKLAVVKSLLFESSAKRLLAEHVKNK